MSNYRQEPSTADADYDARPVLEEEACLIVLQGGRPGRRHDLRGEQKVGRVEDSDIRVDETAVSRVHAILATDGTGVRLRDNESTNGTYVEDRKIAAVWLRDGDRIRVGNTIFKLLLGHGLDLRCHREVDHLVTHDGLTDLLNLAGVHEHLDRIARAGQEPPPALVVIRLDQIEGAKNNHARDIARAGVAAVLRAHTRPIDIVARSGDDELLALLAGFDLAAARRWTTLPQLERETWQFDGHRLRVRASIGCAARTPATANFDELVKHARLAAMSADDIATDDPPATPHPPTSGTPRAALCDLLQSLYSEGELRSLAYLLQDANDLPMRLSLGIPLAQLALEFVLVLERDGLLAVGFERFEHDRPRRRADILAVRARFPT